MRKPKVCILRTAGTNCDKETAFAFNKAGAKTQLVHINRFSSGEKSLGDYQILAIPGGFSYGDDLGAGKVLANELRFKLSDDLSKFVADGKLIIGICNGFQILVKSGLLPGNKRFKQEASLIINDSAKFEDRWVYLKSQAKCVWTKDLPEVIYLPVAHGEGKFVTKDKAVLGRLKKNGQIVFRYCDEEGRSRPYPYNPNGALENIAGICDETGRIFGLMPHPERHIEAHQHPRWTGKPPFDFARAKQVTSIGDGLQIFRNGVEFIRNNF
ncbi:MAG: phosphoribosylformylglycinamidine synthase I [Candidatus Omnitrophica bacterium]|nr:phosphoribosylformylglycinamidine synthase I [Candidatus Omnitrophota bacterium]MBU1870134.1 phosphoribosylformylglycinamidine synthase I [Candidatus Omnitrophota bacterium]